MMPPQSRSRLNNAGAGAVSAAQGGGPPLSRFGAPTPTPGRPSRATPGGGGGAWGRVGALAATGGMRSSPAGSSGRFGKGGKIGMPSRLNLEQQVCMTLGFVDDVA
jgi:hypothetical protein